MAGWGKHPVGFAGSLLGVTRNWGPPESLISFLGYLFNNFDVEERYQQKGDLWKSLKDFQHKTGGIFGQAHSMKMYKYSSYSSQLEPLDLIFGLESGKCGF